jgi:lipoprotein LprG
MGTVDTVRFTLERGGAAVYIDPLDTLEFLSAEGRFEGPTSADAVVRVSAGGFNLQVGAVAVDGELWITNPVTGDWEPTPEGYDFDPAALFDPEIGFRPLLAELTDRELIGLEDRDGEDLYHVTGVAGAERVSTITAGLVSGQDVTVDMWLDPADGAVREAELSTVNGTETSDWRIVFTDYGADLTVEIPDLEG